MRKSSVITVAVAAIGGLLAGPAHATFMVDPDPGGLKFYIDKPANGSLTFCGVVDTNQACAPGLQVDEVNVAVNVGVQTGNGYSNVKPDGRDDVMTTLTFTPESPDVFGDFSFRGQPSEAVNANNPVVISVLGSGGGGAQVFNFFPFNANADFDRIGVVSLDGETIISVEIFFRSGFREVKQIDFSISGDDQPVPEPGSIALFSLGLLGFGASRMRRH
jgi:hypothetical protein